MGNYLSYSTPKSNSPPNEAPLSNLAALSNQLDEINTKFSANLIEHGQSSSTSSSITSQNEIDDEIYNESIKKMEFSNTESAEAYLRSYCSSQGYGLWKTIVTEQKVFFSCPCKRRKRDKRSCKWQAILLLSNMKWTFSVISSNREHQDVKCKRRPKISSIVFNAQQQAEKLNIQINDELLILPTPRKFYNVAAKRKAKTIQEEFHQKVLELDPTMFPKVNFDKISNVHKSMISELCNIMKKDSHFIIQVSEEPFMLLISHRDIIPMISLFGDCIFIDSVKGVTKTEFSVLHCTMISNCGESIIQSICVTENETELSWMQFLSFTKSLVISERVHRPLQTIFSDQAPQIAAAIKQIAPEVNHIFCYHHLKEHLFQKFGKQLFEEKNIYKQLCHLLKENSKDSFESNIECLQKYRFFIQKERKIVKDLDSYISIAKTQAPCQLSTFTSGTIATGRAEGTSADIRRFDRKGKTEFGFIKETCEGLVNKMKKFNITRGSVNAEVKISDGSMKELLSKCFYEKWCEEYKAILEVKYEKDSNICISNSKKYSVKGLECSCKCLETKGFICRHIMKCAMSEERELLCSVNSQRIFKVQPNLLSEIQDKAPLVEKKEISSIITFEKVKSALQNLNTSRDYLQENDIQKLIEISEKANKAKKDSIPKKHPGRPSGRRGIRSQFMRKAKEVTKRDKVKKKKESMKEPEAKKKKK